MWATTITHPPLPHPPFSILLASLDSSLALLLVDGGRQCESIVSCPVPPSTREYQWVSHSLNEYCDFFLFCFELEKNTILSLRDIYDYFCLVNKGRVRISLVFYTKLYSLTLKIVALTFINETNIIIILFYIHVWNHVNFYQWQYYLKER